MAALKNVPIIILSTKPFLLSSWLFCICLSYEVYVPLSSVECQDGTESLVNTVGVEVVSGGGKDAGRLGILEDLICHKNIPRFSNVKDRKIMQ